MAFQLKAKESVNEGIKRVVRREIEKVLLSSDPKGKSTHHDSSEAEAVHEMRKGFKKVRAALRLVREDLGDEVYREENYCFRDAARPLTEVRDADMLVETAEKLRQRLAGRLDSAALKKMCDALCANQQEVARRVLDEERAFTALKNVATAALARVPSWSIKRDGWESLERGLRRVYRAGYRALALAEKTPSVANLHEWRKQSKYLWHLLQLLESAWTDSEKELGNQVHQLSRLLGEDHDLAVLRQALAKDPLSYGGHRFLKDLFGLIDAQRLELERNAFVLGRQLYKDPPKTFTGRIESYCKALRASGAGNTKIGNRARPTSSRRSIPSQPEKRRGAP